MLFMEWRHSQMGGASYCKNNIYYLGYIKRKQRKSGLMHEATVPRPASGKVYLAVEDAKQCKYFLQWALRSIPPQVPLVFLHIYRPAITIPDVLGAPMVPSMLREDLVYNYWENERNKIEKSLNECLQNCKVQAKILIIDKHDVAPALLEIIKEHKIATLVMGAKKRHDWKSKIFLEHDWKSKMAVTLEKQADPSCNILYLHGRSLISSRHPSVNVSTARKNEISSLGGYHFSGSSNTTTSKSSSFFNSRSTANTFDAEQLDDPSLDINPTYIFSDGRFNAIIGLESLGTFKELISQQISAEDSRDLYQAFHSKYCDIFTRCEFIGGFDFVLGVEGQNLRKVHWKSMRSWPAILEYIVSILNLLHTQLKQTHLVCDGFKHDDLLEAAKKPLRHLFTVASVVCTNGVRKSPEMLFCVLNMYTSLAEATSVIRKVFYTESISRDAEGLLAKLKDSAKVIFKELKGLIRTYSSEIDIVVQDEGITSLTEYLMKYIRLLVKHKSSLDTVLGDEHINGLLQVEGINSTTGHLVFGLIADLESVLEKESKLFSSKEHQCIFLMNNMRFILQEVEHTDVWLTAGSRWIRKCQYSIKEYMTCYLSTSWGPVRSILETSNSTSPSKRLRTNILSFLYASPTPMQSFAWSFNETCRAQMCWKVPSPVLRNELRAKILEFVTPAYYAHLESLKEPVGGAAELKSKISELFEG